ncbi:MAG: cell division protein FtsQ/DivIB [Ignavibacteria bacterium]|nr:cell division protein FtsQ/DivIB [Ignavibacteria bacterium]
MKDFAIYLSAVVFLFIVILIVKTAKEYEPKYYLRNIVIENNKIIPSDVLLEFINIRDKNDLNELSAEIIIDRIEKHPYVKKAEGIFVDSTTLKVYVYEVEPFFLVITKGKNFILTKDKRLIPEDVKLNIIDLPILTLDEEILSVNKRLIDEAYQTFLNIHNTDIALFEIISELNINNNSNMVLYLTKPKVKILLGKDFEELKAIYLSEFWRKVILRQSQENYEYIDLRFNDQIIVKSQNSISS